MKDSAQLTWKRGPDDWSIVSACGTYVIRKRMLDTTPPIARYEAIWLAPDAYELPLGRSDDPDTARASCNAHHAKMLAFQGMPV